MNKENPNPEDARLGALLRASRVSPSLPPRFQEGVWRRIDKAEAPASTTGGWPWLDALAALLLRPRFALAAAVILVAVGALLGAHQGSLAANQAAQAQYLAAVSPAALR